MAEKDAPEQETQHKKQKDAGMEAPVDPSDADEDVEQETQHVKRASAESAGKKESDEDESSR